MHICFLAKRVGPETGGLGRHVTELCNEYVKKGHEVTVLTRECPDHSKLKGEVIEVDYPDFKVDALNFYTSVPGFYKELKKRKDDIDIVHGHGMDSLSYLLLNRKFEDVPPFVYTLHGISEKHISRKFLKPVANLLYYPERKVVRSADQLIAVSKDARKRSVEHYSVKKDDIEVVYNGVDVERFRPEGEFGNKILFVGHMNSRKGPEILLKAFRNLSDDYPFTELNFVGGGRLKEEVVRKTEKWGLNDQVSFLENVPEEELIKLYSESIFALPSEYEGLGIVYLEAMACGSPAVGCDLSAVPEVIDDGENGYLIERNPESLENALRKLLSDHKKIKKFGENGREKAEKFQWSKIAEETLEIYKGTV